MNLPPPKPRKKSQNHLQSHSQPTIPNKDAIFEDMEEDEYNKHQNGNGSHNHINKKCITGNFKIFSGINLPNKNLEVEITSNNFSKYNDEIILILFLNLDLFMSTKLIFVLST